MDQSLKDQSAVGSILQSEEKITWVAWRASANTVHVQGGQRCVAECLASVCTQTQRPHQREQGSAGVGPEDSLGLQQCGGETRCLWAPHYESSQWKHIKEKLNDLPPSYQTARPQLLASLMLTKVRTLTLSKSPVCNSWPDLQFFILVKASYTGHKWIKVSIHSTIKSAAI